MKKIGLCLTVIGLLLSSGAEAVLLSRLSGQAVYDTELNITWLGNANLAATETFGITGIGSDLPEYYGSGSMNPEMADHWVAAVNAANYMGYSDWRLPRLAQPDPSCSYPAWAGPYGYGCTGSELGHLFYTELGGAPNGGIDPNNPNALLLNNWGPTGIETRYWSYWPNWLTYAYVGGIPFFDFVTGVQGNAPGSEAFRVWLVRDGDVPLHLSSVPLPGSMLLFSTGFLGLFRTLRRNNR